MAYSVHKNLEHTHNCNNADLPSLSTIVTVIWLGIPIATFSGIEEESIVRIKCSRPSVTLSSIIVTLNDALVSPAAKVTEYSPEM